MCLEWHRQMLFSLSSNNMIWQVKSPGSAADYALFGKVSEPERVTEHTCDQIKIWNAEGEEAGQNSNQIW